jgi:hypothetical protein
MPPDDDPASKHWPQLLRPRISARPPAQIGHAIERGADCRQMTSDAEALGFEVGCDLVARGYVCTTTRNRFVLNAFMRRRAR